MDIRKSSSEAKPQLLEVSSAAEASSAVSVAIRESSSESKPRRLDALPHSNSHKYKEYVAHLFDF